MSDTHTTMDPGAGKAVILKFLRILCGGDTAQHTCLLDWLTHAVQHPNAPGETTLCVSGPQGCGKSQLWNIIRQLLHHGHCIDVGARGLWWIPVLGASTATACIHIGECEQRELMRLVPRIQVRARVVVTTNVALEVAESDLKRFTFIQCSNARVGDQAYFQALHAAIHDAGAISAVCKFLRHRSLWARVRAFVHARVVVLYWLGLTEHLMAPGGAAEARDRMDYGMDFTWLRSNPIKFRPTDESP